MGVGPIAVGAVYVPVSAVADENPKPHTVSVTISVVVVPVEHDWRLGGSGDRGHTQSPGGQQGGEGEFAEHGRLLSVVGRLHLSLSVKRTSYRHCVALVSDLFHRLLISERGVSLHGV